MSLMITLILPHNILLYLDIKLRKELLIILLYNFTEMVSIDLQLVKENHNNEISGINSNDMLLLDRHETNTTTWKLLLYYTCKENLNTNF